MYFHVKIIWKYHVCLMSLLCIILFKGDGKLQQKEKKVALFSFKHGMVYLWTFLLIL